MVSRFLNLNGNFIGPFSGIYKSGVTPVPPSTDFVTTWSIVDNGTAAQRTITLPTTGTGYTDVSIDWGDGTVETGLGDADLPFSHEYAAGTGTTTPTITIGATAFPLWRTNIGGDQGKFRTVENFGSIGLSSSTWMSMFDSTPNVQINATDYPNLTSVTDMRSMFNNIYINWLSSPSIGNWDVSNVQLFGSMFAANPLFNEDIGGWDTSSATDMSSMFGAFTTRAFNQDISDWDVSNVTNMSSMFFTFGTSSFDQNLGPWDISNVTSFSNFLTGCTISTANYNAMWIAWDALPSLKPSVPFHGGNSVATGAGLTARNNIISTYGWTVTDAS